MSLLQHFPLLSFVTNLSVQTYGMMSTPNMKDIVDRNPCGFEGHPMAIGTFFSFQMIGQIAWLYKWYKAPSREQSLYAPVYTIGNFCISAWLIFWNQEAFKMSNVFVTINSLCHLMYMFLYGSNLPSLNLTHLVAASTTGIGILDLMHNGGLVYSADRLLQPSTFTKVITSGALVLSSVLVPSIPLAATSVFNAAALYFAGHVNWVATYAGTLAANAAVVAYRIFA